MDQQSIKSSPRDVFIYILATVALYFSAASTIWLLLSYVDILLPDPLTAEYADPAGAIRWFLAMLVVIFPVFLWTSRVIRQDIAREPQRAELRVRRWLLNLTLFIAALLIIGTLVGLIFNFLEGDLSTQFILKVIAVLLVASGIFWYYLKDLRMKGAVYDARTKSIVYGIIGVVVLIAITGFVLAGSPFRQRLVRFDEQKVNDLQNIQWQVVGYWQKKHVLPSTVSALRDDIAGYVPPNDPQTGESYEYRATGELTFELCAAFNMPSKDVPGKVARPTYMPEKPAGEESWEHGAERTCFSRTIDPELYRPEKPLTSGE